MNAVNPTAPPGVLLTDNPDIAELFNDARFSEGGLGNPKPSLAQVMANIKESFPKESFFLSNQNAGFISLEVQCMLNSPPGAKINLFETSEFFELKLLRSATANIMAQKNAAGIDGVIIGPTQTFYIAFGVGQDLDYWAPFSGYYLIGAESFDDFDEARVITLDFAAGFGLGDFSTNALKNFINPDLLESGYISSFEQFKLPYEEPTDLSPNRAEDIINPYINARRKYRIQNYPFYLAALDNLIEKVLQTIYNTDNVLVINYKGPFDQIDTYVAEQNNAGKIDLTSELSRLKTIQKVPKPDSDDARRLRGFYKVLEDISTFFNFNVSPDWTQPEVITALQFQAPKDDEKALLNNIKSLGFSLNTDKGTGRDKDVINDILKKFINGYNQLLGTDTYCYTRETDLSVLKDVDNAIKKDFNDSFFDRTKPLIIFGPKELVANYFYGQKYDTNLTSDFAKTSQVIEKINQRKLQNVYNLYNSQNINNTSLAEMLKENERLKNLLNDVIKNNNWPIFKYNMQNSNVLSLSVTDNRAYLLLLNKTYSILGNYASIKSTTLKDPTKAVTTSIEEAAIEQLLEKDLAEREAQYAAGLDWNASQEVELDKKVYGIKERFKEARKLAFAFKLSKASDQERLKIIQGEGMDASHIDEIISATFAGNPLPDSDELKKIKETLFAPKEEISDEKKIAFLRSDSGFNEKYLEQEASIYIDYLKSRYGLIATIEDKYARDTLKFFDHQMITMDSAFFQVEIETLPYFPISNFAFLYIPCFLFAQRPNFIGDNKTRNPLDSISRAYNILGYKHTISETKVVSNFKLFSVPEYPVD